VFKSDEDMDARGLAALASKKLPGAYECFLDTLDVHDDTLGRARSATCLGLLGDARALPRLTQTADLEDDERVRDSARSSLAGLQQPPRPADRP
jgi:HEAT repeat protein